jgi:hypothetical protein
MASMQEIILGLSNVTVDSMGVIRDSRTNLLYPDALPALELFYNSLIQYAIKNSAYKSFYCYERSCRRSQ